MKVVAISYRSPQQDIVWKTESNLSPNLIQEKIKFLKYSSDKFIIVTTNNIVYIYGSDANELIKDNNFGNIKFLESGNSHSIIINDLNDFYFYGNIYENFNSKKKFIFNPSVIFKKEIKELRIGEQHVFILTKDNLIYGFGSNEKGQLGLSEDIEFCKDFTKINFNLKVKDLQCGYQHSLLLDFYGSIYVTGSNDYNALGFDSSVNKLNTFTKIELPFKVIKIYGDMCSSFVLSENYELYGVGYNLECQLGLGDSIQRNEFTKINLQCSMKNINVLKSYNEFCFIKDNNDFYFSGFSEYNYLIDKKEASTFVKLNMKDKQNLKYVYPIFMCFGIYLLFIDYKINGEDEEINFLSLKLLQILKNYKLIDIDFAFIN